jgi:hypothetical protein
MIYAQVHLIAYMLCYNAGLFNYNSSMSTLSPKNYNALLLAKRLVNILFIVCFSNPDGLARYINNEIQCIIVYIKLRSF